MLEVADIFHAAGPAYREKFGDRMLPSHRAAMRDIELCRTEAFGGHVAVCDHCDHETYHYHSCRNRHCPKCHADLTARWLERRRQLLLPCPYYLVTFTLPSELRAVARSHQRDVYGSLLREAAATVMTLADDPKWLGARPGILAVLHTWTQAMTYHPHVHLLVTAGGWSEIAASWMKPPHERFLLSGRALSTLFHTKVKCAIYRHGLYRQVSPRAWQQRWSVHCQPAGDGSHVLEYLGRYVYRIAITNRRLVRFVDGNVTFTYRDRDSHQLVYCTVTAEEFIRRFLQHVLPRGFTKVRYYGLFSPACSHRLERARNILSTHATATSLEPPVENDNDDREGVSTAATDTACTGHNQRCPSCGVGRLRLIPIPRKKRKPP